MAKQTITIYDVAREAGVSMATVSRVVNGNPNVKPSTRKKVSDVIEKLNYRPNAVARGLASKKTTTVGVILPSVTNLFFAQLARGIDDIALMYKYNIILANSDESKEKEIILNSSLSKLETELNNESFVKPHRSYLINLEHVNQISTDFLLMANLDKIPLSRRLAADVQRAFIQHYKGVNIYE